MSRRNTSYELDVVKRTAERCKDFPSGNLSVVERDPPDILLESRSRIGIEVVRFFAGPKKKKSKKHGASAGSLIQAVQAQRQRIMETAHQLYDRSSTRPLVVDAVWHLESDPPERIPKHLVGDIATSIAAGAIAIEKLANWDTIDVEDWVLTAPWDHPLSPYMPTLIAQGGRRVTQASLPSHSGMIHEEPIIFQDLIVKKEKDLNRYATQYDEVWLVIEVPWVGWGEVGPEAASHPYKTQFDRVYFYQGESRVAHRVL